MLVAACYWICIVLYNYLWVYRDFWMCRACLKPLPLLALCLSTQSPLYLFYLLGDIMLLNDGLFGLYGGLGVFSLGHIYYLWMWTHVPVLQWMQQFAFIYLFVAFGIYLIKNKWFLYGMGAYASWIVLCVWNAPTYDAMTAYILFGVSDLMLALNLFVLNTTNKWIESLSISSYWLSVYLIYLTGSSINK